MNKFLVLIFLVFIIKNAKADILSGYVKDAKSNESLLGATIYCFESKKIAKSNEFGYFALEIGSYPIKLTISFIGYNTDTFFVQDKEQKTFLLSQTITSIKEVKISAKNLRITNPQSIIMTPMQAKNIPAMFGEVDILKTLQLMPGIQSGQEGTSGLYIRGGTPDQNLILIDDVPLYFVNHLGGFVSIFDVNAINKVEVFKGAFPAKYGGRLSSVLDIRMKEGNSKKINTSLELGWLTSKIAINGPINKKTTFMFSARRCNLDIPTRLYSNYISSVKGDVGFTFYDLYSKISYKLDKNNKFYFSFYKGNDKLFINLKNQNDYYSNSVYNYNNTTKWGNVVAIGKWTNNSIKKMFLNTTISYNKYNYSSSLIYDATNTQASQLSYSGLNSFESNIEDVTAKIEGDYLLNKHKLNFGLIGISHFFKPGLQKYKKKSTSNNQDTTIAEKQLFPYEFSAYLEDNLEFSEKINLVVGLHANYYWIQKKDYKSLQPRCSIQYFFNNEAKFSASFSTMNQNIHLLSNTGVGLPTDLWLPTTSLTKPEKSQQFSIGYYKNNFKNQFNFSIETYYKTFTNLIEFSEGQSFFSGGNNWEEKIQQNGQGKAYGVELFLEKSIGDFKGFISYTVSATNRKFDSINNGNWYPYKYDRRHNFNISGNYKINKQLSISSNFIFQSGNAITLTEGQIPINYYTSNNSFVPKFALSLYDAYYYSGRNQSRMPSYHRLDVSLNINKEKKNGNRTWSFGLYNIYAKQNPYYLFFDYDKDINLHLYQLSLFPFMPSINFIRNWN